MSEAQNNIKILHRKEWQTMMPADTITAANMFVVNDNANLHRFAFYMCSATVHYLYDHEQDGWLPITSGAFSPAIAAGACGTYCDWSPTYTATGGTVTTITVAFNTHNINEFVVGKTVEFLSGTAANIGLRKTITDVHNTGVAGSTITLTFTTALPEVVANNDTFRVMSGSFFIFTSGVLATSFKRFDIGTMSWGGTLSIANLVATWGTDGRMVTPCICGTIYDSGTADADSSTTALEDDGKGWAVDQWIGYQVRITAGTGIGQKRVITDNDADTLTIASGTDLDDTSQYVIEGDEDAIYLLGNNVVTVEKYSISGNSWAHTAPTAARGGNAVAGMTADFIGKTGNTLWADITAIHDGRYIYSFRGGASNTILDRFNINGGTNGVPTWETITYLPALQIFTAGVGTDWDSGTGNIYIAKEGSATVPQRIYCYDVTGNSIVPVAVDWYLGGAVLQGNKIWIRSLSSSNLVKWLYCLQSTSTNLRRIMLF